MYVPLSVSVRRYGRDETRASSSQLAQEFANAGGEAVRVDVVAETLVVDVDAVEMVAGDEVLQ